MDEKTPLSEFYEADDVERALALIWKSVNRKPDEWEQIKNESDNVDGLLAAVTDFAGAMVEWGAQKQGVRPKEIMQLFVGGFYLRKRNQGEKP